MLTSALHCNAAEGVSASAETNSVNGATSARLGPIGMLKDWTSLVKIVHLCQLPVSKNFNVKSKCSGLQ